MSYATSRMVTQKDVARHAKVSQATVSLILNGVNRGTSSATRVRVLDAVEKLGYVANPAARGLRGSPTRVIGLVVRQLRQSALLAMVEAVVRAGREAGLYMLVADASGNAKDALSLMALFKSRLCDGLVLVGDLREEGAVWGQLPELALPTVGLFQGSRNLPFYNVSVDNKRAARAALRHLYDLGHRSIAYIDAVRMHGPAERRLTYKRFVRQRLLTPLVVESDGSASGGETALDKLLEGPQVPTAIFAANDEVAVGVLARAAARGIAVPRAISVVGFDDIGLAAHLVPPLTTVRQPLASLASTAIHALTSGQATKQANIEIAGELIVRGSTAAPLSATAQRLR